MQATQINALSLNLICSVLLHGVHFSLHKNFDIEPQEVY